MTPNKDSTITCEKDSFINNKEKDPDMNSRIIQNAAMKSQEPRYFKLKIFKDILLRLNASLKE